MKKLFNYKHLALTALLSCTVSPLFALDQAKLVEMRETIETKEDLLNYSQKNLYPVQEFSGTLSIEHVDDHQNEREFNFFKVIYKNGNERSINPIDESFASEFNGKEVEVTSINIEGESYAYIAETEGQRIPAPPTTYEKSLLLLVDFNDSQAPFQYQDGRVTLSFENVKHNINNGHYARYLQDLFRETKTKVTRVEDWYTFNRNCDDTYYPLNNGTILGGHLSNEDVEEILDARGIDVSGYDNIDIIANCKLWTGWGVAGTLFVQGKRIKRSFVSQGNRRLHFGPADGVVPGYNFGSFLAHFIHERLHTFGFGHARGTDCGDSEVLFPCDVLTYGNAFDVMGSGRRAHATNADVMKRKSLRDPQNNYLYISENGIYELDALQSDKRNAKLGAYIISPYSASPVFMVENRRGKKVDALIRNNEFHRVINGLTLYSAISTSSDGSDGEPISSPRFQTNLRMIDPNPNSFEVGQTFLERTERDGITKRLPYFDPITGVRIEVLDEFPMSRSEKVRFRVTFDDRSRECFKAVVAEQVGKPWIKKVNQTINTKTTQGITKLNRGDIFEVMLRSFQSNELYCPRDLIEVKVLNAAEFEGWIGSPNYEEMDEDECNALPFGCPRDYNPLSFTTVMSDYNKVQSFAGQMKIKQNPVLGEHSLQVQFKNRRTNNTLVKNLTFRVQ
jgi:hypothetical protein